MQRWIILNLEYMHPEWNSWYPVIANFYNIETDRSLFNALAGTEGSPTPLYPARGLPEGMSIYIHRHYYTEILPDDAGDAGKNLIHQWCYERQAQDWVQNDGATIVELGDRRFVSDTLAHHESYLNLFEINDACEHVGHDISTVQFEFSLVLDFMHSIDRRLGDGASRIVFWFQN